MKLPLPADFRIFDRLKLLDRYILQKFLGTFFFAIAVLSAIIVVFDVSEKIDDMIEKHAPFSEIALDYYLNFIPYYATLLSPLFVFIAVIFFTSKMTLKSEIVAIMSGGVSFYRMLRPYMFGAFILALLSYTFTGWILPPANARRIAFENKYIRDKFIFNKRNIHFQTNKVTYIFLESYSNIDSVGFRLSVERIVDGQLVKKLMAERLSWNREKRCWRIENYYIRSMEGGKERLYEASYVDTIFGFKPDDFERPLVEDVSLMNNAELERYIVWQELKATGQVTPFLLEKYGRIAIPFSTFILTLIGVSVSSKKARGGMGVQLGIGIGISFVYVVMMRFTMIFATQADLPPLLAAWIPNIVFGIVAIIMVRLAPK